MAIVWFIIILSAIVIVHELGHFIFAKLSNTYVYEFAIGMGPKIFSKKNKSGETEYSIRAIPIGGSVSLAGEEIDDDKKIPKNRKLQAKTFLQRFLIMVSGAGFNFIFAFAILFISGLIYGCVSVKPIIADLTKDYPAYDSGLEVGDTIISINGDKVSSWSEVQLVIQSSDGKELVFKVKDNNNNYKTINITPKKITADNGDVVYAIGIYKSNLIERGFLISFEYAINTTKSLFNLMFATIKSLFLGNVSVNDLSGPVGIYTIVDSQSKEGFNNILNLIAFLSVNVGVINLLPFPAFDGGRVLFLIIEKIIRKPIPPRIENTIHSIGFFLLIALMIYVTFNDVFKLFK